MGSMSLTLNSAGVVVVDDTNVTVIYQGTWITGGVRREYDSTTHGTSQPGSTATFLFNGTSVAVYGTFGPEGTPTVTYSLDNASLVTVTAPPVRAPVHQTLFFQSPDLQDSAHQLVITSLNHNGIYWLDYFLYIPSLENFTALSPSSPAPLSSTPISIPQSSTQSSKPLPTTTSSSSVGTTRTKDVAIIGGVLGGILGGVLLLAGILAVLYYKRRRVTTIPVETRSRPTRPSIRIDPYPFAPPRRLSESQQDYPNRRVADSYITSLNTTAYPSRSPPLSSLSDIYATERPASSGLPYLDDS